MSQPTTAERLKAAVSKNGKFLPPLELAQRGLVSLAAVFVGLTVFAALIFAVPWLLWAAGAAWLYYRAYGLALPPRVVASVASSREAWTASSETRAAAKRASKAAAPAARPAAGGTR